MAEISGAGDSSYTTLCDCPTDFQFYCENLNSQWRYTPSPTSSLQQKQQQSIQENFDFDQNMEQNIDKYEDESANERYLICEVTIPSKNTLIRVSTGLSSIRNFSPVVKIWNWEDQCIIFTKNDWNFFVNFMKSILKDLDTNKRIYFYDTSGSTQDTYYFGDYSVRVMKNTDFHNDQKMVELSKKNVKLWLGQMFCKNLMKFDEMIRYRLHFLESLHFDDFYNHFMSFLTKGHLTSTEIKCTIPINLECMKEFFEMNIKNIISSIQTFEEHRVEKDEAEDRIDLL